MSSDYEPHGSISNSQLSPQRKHKDTYFGELVLQNTKTGENTADNIRSDIFDGSNARIRRYVKAGEKYGFSAQVSFPQDYDTSGYAAKITLDTGVTPIDSIVHEVRNIIDETQYGWSEYSMARGFYRKDIIDPITTLPAIAYILAPDLVTDKYITDIVSSSFFNGGKYVFYFTDGTTENTTIKPPDYDDWSNPIDYPGYHCEYLSNGERHYYYSTSTIFETPVDISEEARIFPIVPFQDNGNGELPYESNIPPEDYENERRHKTMRAIGVDFEPMSRQIFTYIPALGSAEWNITYHVKYIGSPSLQSKYATEADYHAELSAEISVPDIGTPEWSDYRRSWKANIKNCCKTRNAAGECTGAYDNDPRPEQIEFCDDYPTEQIYHDKLVQEKIDATSNIKNITDVHFGLFVSAKKLDEDNCVALFFTLAPILGKMLKSPVPVTTSTFAWALIPALQNMNKAYKFKIEAGSFKALYAVGDYSVCRRYGVADPIFYPPGVKTAKYRHGASTILEDSTLYFDEGTTYHTIDPTYEGHRPPDWDGTPASGGGWDGEDATYAPSSMLELRVQDKPDPITGEPRFLELRLYDPAAEHTVDVYKDGDHGRSATVGVFGSLTGIYSDPAEYSDTLLWPVAVDAVEELRFFKKERFLRESMIMNVCAIRIQEIKWYQQGWFKIVLVIVSMVVAYFTGYFGFEQFAASAAAGATVAVLTIVSMVVENPLIRAVIQLIMLYFTGFADTNSLMQNAALMVEAAGIVVQTSIAMDMIKLKEEMDAFRKMVNEKAEEMEKMKKEVGMDEFNKEMMLYISSLAPVEYADDFYERALDKDLNKIDIDSGVIVDSQLPTPQS